MPEQGEEESRSSSKSNDSVPSASSTLMGLFQPPPSPASTTSTERKKQELPPPPPPPQGLQHPGVAATTATRDESSPLIRDAIFEKLFNVPGRVPTPKTNQSNKSGESSSTETTPLMAASSSSSSGSALTSVSTTPTNNNNNHLLLASPDYSTNSTDVTPRIGSTRKAIDSTWNSHNVPSNGLDDDESPTRRKINGIHGGPRINAGLHGDPVAPSATTPTPSSSHSKSISSLPPIFEQNTISSSSSSNAFPSAAVHNRNGAAPTARRSSRLTNFKSKLTDFLRECCQSTTWIGAFMFLLYHVVFCLTMGSAIIRPHGNNGVSMLGLFTKMAALGVFFGAPVYFCNLRDIPTLYPTTDLFSAPFLANIAMIVDETLFHDDDVSDHDNDQVFLATFSFLACMGVLISGSLMYLATIFKLANLGSYLPFPVLCGFFAAVGVLTWTLAIKVDTGGIGIGHVIFSGDASLMLKTVIHHAPSVVIAILMKYLGPKNPFYVIGLVFSSIGLFYSVMLVSGYSKEQAIKDGWLWATSDLEYKPMYAPIGFSVWAPPAPFGWINSLVLGKVHWNAVAKGMETTLALSFLYLIRCSLHGAALRRNVSNLHRTVKETELMTTAAASERSIPVGAAAAPTAPSNHRRRISEWTSHRRKFSEVVDMDWISNRRLGAGGTGGGEGDDQSSDNGHNTTTKTRIISAKPTHSSLKEILTQYAYSQFICGFVGSFAVTPSVAASSTMYKLGAEAIAPQFFSCVFLVLFYLTNFALVSYIPKPAFSSLLVLAFIDMIDTWFIKSYFKTREKFEWLVVPTIVVLAFVVGLLGAVFLGIAMSTFLFVASFFRSGVVKYIANGITIRSTIERPPSTACWLDQHGDLIQILVLQNYLFFGNASSTLDYISSMFEHEPSGEGDDVAAVAAESDATGMLPPLPKIIILDLTLVTGMDTSAVDVFSGILNLCGKEDCRLFIAGVASNVRQVMQLSGFKPETTTAIRSKRRLRFFPDLDMAVGKAEDLLLSMNSVEDIQIRRPAGSGGGFNNALDQIDEQLHINCYHDLIGLKEYTTEINVEAGQALYQDIKLERGLFFIECGVIKLERDTEATLSRSRSSTDVLPQLLMGQNNETLSAKNARSITIARELARLKAGGGAAQARNKPTFRIARVGPGWVLGADEVLTGEVSADPSKYIAVSPCRLHFIPFKTLDKLEETEPLLVLKLHKLLSFLSAKRHSVTINQLATLHSIMSAPAHKKPIRRSSSQD